LQKAAQPLVVIDHKQVRGSGTVHRHMDMGRVPPLEINRLARFA
jgi:hypothetical protein